MKKVKKHSLAYLTLKAGVLFSLFFVFAPHALGNLDLPEKFKQELNEKFKITRIQGFMPGTHVPEDDENERNMIKKIYQNYIIIYGIKNKSPLLLYCAELNANLCSEDFDKVEDLVYAHQVKSGCHYKKCTPEAPCSPSNYEIVYTDGIGCWNKQKSGRESCGLTTSCYNVGSGPRLDCVCK